jgi:hypothetical protein
MIWILVQLGNLIARSVEKRSKMKIYRAICHELVIKSRPHSTQLKKSSSFDPFEKAVPIQPIWKSRPHSIQPKKPSSFNPFEKPVPI